MKVVFTIIFLFTGYFVASAQNDTTRIIFSWKLSKDYLLKDTTEVDTSLIYFHQDDPTSKYSFGNSFLGNIGSPVLPELFFNRYDNNEFYFLNYYYPYLETIDKTAFYNTRRQFTKLTYINGGISSSREEILDVFHTQNVTSVFNFGLKFYTIASKGQYFAQKTRRNSYKIFYSYEGKKFQSYFNINSNNFTTNENGGISSDSLLGEVSINSTGDIPTIFGDIDLQTDDSDVKNQFKTLSFELVNKVDMLKLFSRYVPDSLISDSLISNVKFGLIFKTGFESYKRTFYDIDPIKGDTLGFYDTMFFNQDNTFDSLHYKKFYNSLRLYFSPYKRISAFFGASHELVNYYFYSADVIQNKEYPVENKNKKPFFYTYSFYNLLLNSGLSLSIANLYWDFTGDYYLSGYRKNSYDFSGAFSILQKSEKNSIIAGFNISSVYPYFLYQNFYSNSFIWRNHFQPVKKLHWSINYTYSPNKIESELNFAVLRDLIYFDTNAYPRQYAADLQVFSGIFKKDFKFWKFTSLNNIAFQYVNNRSIIQIPNFVFNNTTFFQQRIFFKFTGGEFFTVLGFTMNLSTKYYIPAYMPHVGGFYNQEDSKYGNYPYVDIFLNIKLKRARFFFKFEHINSGLFDKNYFSVLHYPRNERMFKVGVSWNFYD